jgi:hypothetical protein
MTGIFNTDSLNIDTKIKSSAKKYDNQIVMKTFYNMGKGKAIPLQAWTGPEGSRRLRLPDFKTIST